MDYTCKTDTHDVILNDEAEEYSWVALEDISNYPLGGFTESLLNKIKHKDNTDQESIYYNYN